MAWMSRNKSSVHNLVVEIILTEFFLEGKVQILSCDKEKREISLEVYNKIKNL
jgi:hypothetical protein